MVEEGEKDQEKEETRVLIEKAKQSLEQAIGQDHLRMDSLEALLDIFRRDFEGQ